MVVDAKPRRRTPAVAVPRSGRVRRGPWWTWLALVLPGLTLFTVFELYPLVRTFVLSLYRWDGFSPPEFVGVANFRSALTDAVFWTAVRHSLMYAAGTTVAKLVLGLVIALVLDRQMRGRAVYRSLVFAPALMSYVAVALLWSLLFNPSLGPVARMFAPLGLVDPELGILGDPDRALAAVMVVDVWKWVGYHAVLFLAGLSLVSRDQVEAATVDGASAAQRLRHVTLPAIRQIIVINVIIALAGAMNAFDLVFVMTKGGPYRSSELMLTYMYSVAFSQNRFGLASAIACVLFAAVGLMTLVVFRIGRAGTVDE